MAGEWQKPGLSNDLCEINISLHSPGIWSLIEVRNFMYYPLSRVILQLTLMFMVTQLLHLVLRRLCVPRTITAILAGILLGPSVLGLVSTRFQRALFPSGGHAFLFGLAKFGYIFFMFLIGVKIDPGMILRTGKKAWTIGILAVLLPVISGFYASYALYYHLDPYRIPMVQTVISVQTLMPFPVIACFVVDLKIMNSELGRLALASALIAELCSTFFSMVVFIVKIGMIAYAFSNGMQSTMVNGLMIAVILFVARPAFMWVIKNTPEGKPVKSVYVFFVALGVLVFAVGGHMVGLMYQMGPFLLGLAVPHGPPLGSTVAERLETAAGGLFAPLLLTVCGMKFDMRSIFDFESTALMLKLVVVSSVVKFSTVFFPAMLCRVPPRDAAALAVILSVQGIVEMANYLDNLFIETIDVETFTAVTLALIIISTASVYIVNFLYDSTKIYAGYQKRDILHSPYNSELRILACTHRLDEAIAAIKLLEASNPTKESPIAAYALHLVELAGQAAPILINHKLGQRATAGGGSQQIVDVFGYYEKQNSGLATVHVFTSVSLPKFMHHDICTMAFDKLASMIILPFHRKWNQQGKVVLDSSFIRGLNLLVLDMAPCSVGTLVDRRKLRPSAPPDEPMYRVAVVFIGGDDDREALAYGKRMVQSSAVHLTVLRLTAWEEMPNDEWEAMLDTESLRDLRHLSQRPRNLVYREERVRDGADTANIINSMVECFDLIVVGRRHREDTQMLSGLSEWCELPEMGPVGDMLASADIDKPVSVLVIQQQLVQVK